MSRVKQPSCGLEASPTSPCQRSMFANLLYQCMLAPLYASYVATFDYHHTCDCYQQAFRDVCWQCAWGT